MKKHTDNFIELKRKEYEKKFKDDVQGGDYWDWDLFDKEVWSFIASIIKQADQIGYARGKEEEREDIFRTMRTVASPDGYVHVKNLEKVFKYKDTWDNDFDKRLKKFINQSLEGKQSKK